MRIHNVDHVMDLCEDPPPVLALRYPKFVIDSTLHTHKIGSPTVRYAGYSIPE